MASAMANQVEPFADVRDLLAQLSRNAPPPGTTLLRNVWLSTHPKFSPVLVAVAGRTEPATGKLRGYGFCLKT